MKKIIHIPVAEITAAIRDDIPDEELRKKYGLSEKGLERLFGKLVKAVSGNSREIEIESDGSEPQ